MVKITKRPKDIKRITVEVEREDYIKLKIHLARKNKSLSQWVRGLIDKLDDK